MSNAGRDLLGTPRLEKSGWWPDLRQRHLFNDSIPTLQFPFFCTKTGLKIMASVRSSGMIKGDKPAVQQQTIRMLDALVNEHG